MRNLVANPHAKRHTSLKYQADSRAELAPCPMLGRTPCAASPMSTARWKVWVLHRTDAPTRLGLAACTCLPSQTLHRVHACTRIGMFMHTHGHVRTEHSALLRTLELKREGGAVLTGFQHRKQVISGNASPLCQYHIQDKNADVSSILKPAQNLAYQTLELSPPCTSSATTEMRKHTCNIL